MTDAELIAELELRGRPEGFMRQAAARLRELTQARDSAGGSVPEGWLTEEMVESWFRRHHRPGIDDGILRMALAAIDLHAENAALRERAERWEREAMAWRATEHLRKDEPHAEFVRLAEARAANQEPGT